MRSDRSIREAVAQEKIVIDTFVPDVEHGSSETPNLGTSSYNLEVKNIYELVGGASFKDMPENECGVDAFLEKYGRQFSGFLDMHRNYVAVTGENLRAFESVVITTRSSAARLGIEVTDAYPGRWQNFDRRSLVPRPVYLRIRAFAPVVVVKEGDRLCQSFFKPSFYVNRDAFRSAVADMESYPDMTLLSQTRYGTCGSVSPDGIVLHMGNKVKIHNGNALEWGKDNKDAFDEVDVTGIHELEATGKFCIIPSLEYIKLPPTHVGWLWNFTHIYNPIIMSSDHQGERKFMIHPNAPAVNAGSEGNQIFETWHAYEMTFSSRREEPTDFETDHYHDHRLRLSVGKPFAIMSLHPLDKMPERAYSGKYKGQRGPQLSRSHLD